MLLDEIEHLFFTHGNIKIRTYYKTVKGLKHYYDFQLLEEKPLNGSYQNLQCLEILYYLLKFCS